MSVLSHIDRPSQVKDLSLEECGVLADELRQQILETVSRRGGHLASNLGIVDMTVALHKVLNLPQDKLIFDVGHQVYAHKLLTGRREEFDTLRSYGGISGFPCRQESEYDLFDTGHSSTAISLALGLARARDLAGENYAVVAVVGDGAMTGGMCYEAMNDAGNSRTKLIVVLNDNEMSISPNVGALSSYFRHLRASASWYGSKKKIKSNLEKVPLIGKPLAKFFENAKNMVKSVTTGGELFEALGFRYLGPFDGHDIGEMVHVLEEAMQIEDTPILIHLVTTKGKGYDLAEHHPEDFHGVAPFYIETGLSSKSSSSLNAASVVGEELCAMAADDARVVALTAAMASGTGLIGFSKYFPDRFLDVGIAEQHAVTMSAGLARGGFRPYFAVYATFLQRSFDQMVHDVCLQDLPVTVLADHAGLVGNDGKTHHGVFAVSMILPLPNMTLLAPRSARQLRGALRASLRTDHPVVILYPKSFSSREFGNPDSFEAGKWEILRDGSDALVFCYGSMVPPVMDAAGILQEKGVSITVVDCSTLKPLDEEMLRTCCSRNIPLFAVEEEQEIGGFGSELLRICSQEHLQPLTRVIGLPDRFIGHGDMTSLYRELGLLPQQLAERLLTMIKETDGNKHA